MCNLEVNIETQVLAMMVTDSPFLKSVSTKMKPDYFSSPACADIAEAVISYYNENNALPSQFEIIKNLKGIVIVKDEYFWQYIGLVKALYKLEIDIYTKEYIIKSLENCL